MTRGTTPTNTFNTAIDLTGAEVIYITYDQNERTVIEKNKSDMTVTEHSIEVKLTQEETLRLREDRVEIQISARFPDGTVVRSNIMRTTAEKVLKEEAI